MLTITKVIAISNTIFLSYEADLHKDCSTNRTQKGFQGSLILSRIAARDQGSLIWSDPAP